MKNTFFARGFALLAMTGASLLAYADEGNAVSIADKVHLDIEFNGSVLSADSDGVVDSMADAGFNEDGTSIALSYEGEWWGGTASLDFANENFRIFFAEGADALGQSPLSIGDLFVWIKPFGEHFKFTGGIFENTDGLADYVDDIDDFPMGVFLIGEDGGPFEEPEDMTNAALTSGFLTDAVFGPVTLQFLLAPNYSPEGASALATGYFSSFGWSSPVDAGERFFRFGGRVIIDAGVGTAVLMAKTFRWPIEVMNTQMDMLGLGRPYAGTKADYTTFGAYFDLTALENLGVSLGYTGFLPYNDADDVDNILWNGVDLRATWTGIEGLSVSSHNNISFAKGAEKEWMGLLTDGSFFSLYNAIGATKELNEKFSVNAELANVFTQIDDGTDTSEFESFWLEGKLITRVGENAEFSAGLRLGIDKVTDEDALTVFSIPIGIKVSF
ncbi:MAG: hypothetical protein LBD48_08195 [Treponema sp.]|nr:hypothetical protein [Treponema sp.]